MGITTDRDRIRADLKEVLQEYLAGPTPEPVPADHVATEATRVQVERARREAQLPTLKKTMAQFEDLLERGRYDGELGMASLRDHVQHFGPVWATVAERAGQRAYLSEDDK